MCIHKLKGKQDRQDSDKKKCGLNSQEQKDVVYISDTHNVNTPGKSPCELNTISSYMCYLHSCHFVYIYLPSDTPYAIFKIFLKIMWNDISVIFPGKMIQNS
jgi:hypothetical protein